MSQEYQIPVTPSVIAPSPTTSEAGDSSGGYFTRSAARRVTSSSAIEEEKGSEKDVIPRARSRSRSPKPLLEKRRPSGLPPKKKTNSFPVQKSEPLVPNAVTNGHLSPSSAAGGIGSSYWRAISRSPSPLGLIPIHRHWRSFVHKHEVPRKALHVSIGFFTLFLYTRGAQTDDIHPWLLGALIPIASLDVLRHHSAGFNRAYVRVCGALMRETEVNDRYNGVIWYLLGAWAALRFFPKDVGVMSVMLLSWCDTAASTFGRLYGRNTPRIRKGKSLAGSLAALVVGVSTACLFWGYVAPTYWGFEESFMFKDRLTLPESMRLTLGYVDETACTITGWAAVGVMSICSGLVASASELVDVLNLDDNVTIPILSAAGLWSFLKVFG
ncbi:MAG: hypothetical protein LQ340_002791 [Diploschistes diacapsis]|nr:MAG: hypothetical protein LQ340_002791 [Diploschistes diacapsis]